MDVRLGIEDFLDEGSEVEVGARVQSVSQRCSDYKTFSLVFFRTLEAYESCTFCAGRLRLIKLVVSGLIFTKEKDVCRLPIRFQVQLPPL